MKIKKFNRIFLVLLITFSMFAAGFSAANITAYSEEQAPSVNFSYNEEPGVFRINVDIWDFYNVSNLTFQMTYDTDVLKYSSFTAGEKFSSVMLSVNDNDGTLTVALVSLAPINVQWGTMITFEFEMLNSEPVSFESKAKVIDCTDSFLNPIHISIQETSGFYVKNDASTGFDLYLNSQNYNVNLYEDVAFTIGFNRNYGLYSGSITLRYDANVLEFVGCEFSNPIDGMILEYTDLSDGENGIVNIAFAGTEAYSNHGQFIDCIFLPKVEGYAYVILGNATITNKDLKETKGEYGYGTSIYVSDHKSYNYFSTSTPETVKTGDTFDVILAINNNSGFNALTATLSYDTSVFEFVGAEFIDSVFSGALTSVTGATPGQIRFGVVGTSSITENGEFLKVKLRAINDVCCTSRIELQIIEFVDTPGSALDYSNNIGTIDATNHAESDWIIEREATCIEDGSKYKECTVCGAVVETEVIPAKDHTASEWIIDYDASCWSYGYKHKDCTVCGMWLEGTDILPLNHVAGDWIIDSEATCWSYGYQHKSCTMCGTWLEDMNIPPLEHTASDWIIDCDSTTETDGYKHKECIVCGSWLEGKNIPAKIHSPGDWIIDYDSTCSSEGYKHKECTECGVWIEEESIPMYPHTISDWKIDTDATCVGEGYKHKECTVCGAVVETDSIPVTDHTASDWIIDTNATCVDEGYKHKECTVCGTIIEMETISASGHTASDWIIDTNATCVGEGSKYKECTVCGAVVETGSIPVTDHTASDWIIDTNATCLNEGSKHKECTVCGTVIETEIIPFADHTAGNWMVDYDATCWTYGYQHKDCIVCGTWLEGIEIPLTDHTASDWIIDTNATCVGEGSKHKECTVCAKIVETEIIPATGHSLGEWYTSKSPTCTAKGEERRDCDDCDHFETRELEIVDHTYTAVVTKPTCTEGGYTTHKCVCGDSYVDTYTEATGHSFTDYVSDGNATLEADGTKTAVCDNGCGKKDTVTDEGSKLEFNDITSDIFEVKDNFISGISVKTTVKELKESVNETGYVRVVKDGKVVEDNTSLATGMKIQLMNGTEVLKEVTVVVTGDTNGDGNISVTDMISVKAHILKKSTLTDAYGEAGDTNGDGSISITDFIQIKAHILGKSSLEKKSVKTVDTVKYNAAPAQEPAPKKETAKTESVYNVYTADFLVPARFVFLAGTETIKRSF